MNTQGVSAETISFDGGPPRAWDEARSRLGTAASYWLATVRADGRPHLVPVLSVLVDGSLYFVASETSRKAKNIARDPRCVISASTEGLDVVVEGVAAKVGEERALRPVADVYAREYDWHVTVHEGAFHEAEGAPTAGPPPYEVYELIPTKAFGFGTVEPARSTRWRFAPDREHSG